MRHGIRPGRPPAMGGVEGHLIVDALLVVWLIVRMIVRALLALICRTRQKRHGIPLFGYDLAGLRVEALDNADLERLPFRPTNFCHRCGLLSVQFGAARPAV